MSRLRDYLQAYLKKTLDTLESIPLDAVEDVIAVLHQARARRNQVFVCGNGGSAATASHFANDLGKGASYGRDLRFRVIALTDNVAWLTALANDVSYDDIFVEQLKNFAMPDDVLVAFSGSGESENVIRAVEWAEERGLITVGISGQSGRLVERVRYPVRVGSSHMGRIEDAHFLIQHLIGYSFMDSDQSTLKAV